MSNSEELDEAWDDFASICAEPPPKRDICSRCERPNLVCYCAQITPTALPIRSNVIMLQHPNEVKRCLRTTKIIELSLPPDRYHVFRSKRFSEKKFPELFRLLSDATRETILVFPSDSAIPIGDLPPIGDHKPYNVAVLDGTWSQAKVLYNSNSIIRSLRCVKLENTQPSRYVIRTQPTENCLSTVEAVGLVLAHLESSPAIMSWFTRPLNAICEFQLNNGAVTHQSKEYMITNGLYKKPLNKRVQKSLDRKLPLDIKDLLT